MVVVPARTVLVEVTVLVSPAATVVSVVVEVVLKLSVVETSEGRTTELLVMVLVIVTVVVGIATVTVMGDPVTVETVVVLIMFFSWHTTAWGYL